MSFIAARVAIARENEEVRELTENEELVIAPPDEQEQDPQVNAEMAMDDTEEIQQDTEQAFDDQEEVASIADRIEDEDGDVSPEALVVAQERLNAIYRRYDLSTKSLSRESASYSTRSKAREMVRIARENEKLIGEFAQEGVKELADRMRVNMQNFFKWRTTYVKEARNVAQQASQTQGSPNESARYTNKIRIAHFCDANMEPQTDPKALADVFQNTNETIKTMHGLMDVIANSFALFEDPEFTLDFDKIFRDWKPTGGTNSKGHVLSAHKDHGLFGEQYLITNIPQGSRNDLDLALAALAKMSFVSVWRWQVKDLDIGEGLEVYPASKIAAAAKDLERMGDLVHANYDMSDHAQGTSAGYLMGRDNTWVNVLEFLKSPMKKLKFSRSNTRLIANLTRITQQVVDLEAKAMNCLLDYYKWSLKNHGSAGEEGIDQE